MVTAVASGAEVRDSAAVNDMLTFRIDDELELRLPRASDAQAHLHLLDQNREHLGRWLPWARAARTLDQERAAIQRLRLAYANGDGLSFAIRYRGTFAGITGLYAIDAGRGAASLGYWLGEDFVGRGIVVRASLPILRHGFSELRLVRITADPDANNLRSLATLERLGFRRERTDRKPSTSGEPEVEVHTYALLAEAWPAAAKAVSQH